MTTPATKSTTIDTFSKENHNAYALNQKEQELYRQEQLKGVQDVAGAVPAASVPQQFAVDTAKPAIPLPDKAFAVGRPSGWIHIEPPPQFSTARLLVQGLSIYLGDTDKLQETIDRIEGARETAPPDEYSRIHAALERARDLTRVHEDFEAKRNQFHRG